VSGRRKLYIGERLAAAAGGGLAVTVRTGETEEALKHYVLHSPDGFEVGYSGSGPSDLARCILIDYFGGEAAGGEDEADRLVAVSRRYQVFRDDVIAGLSREKSWQITGDQIAAWLRSVES
jgi:hypothetical protein